MIALVTQATQNAVAHDSAVPAAVAAGADVRRLSLNYAEAIPATFIALDSCGAAPADRSHLFTFLIIGAALMPTRSSVKSTPELRATPLFSCPAAG